MSGNFSMTNSEVPIKEIVEPLTIVRQSLRIKEEQLSTAITQFQEFLSKHDTEEIEQLQYELLYARGVAGSEHLKKSKSEIELIEKKLVKLEVPYALREENRSEYKPLIQTIERAMTYALTTAKRLRQELYNTPNEEVNYIPDNSLLQNIDREQFSQQQPEPQQNKLKQILGMTKKVHFDPHSPMAKMEELIAGLTEIIAIFNRWIIWFEGLIFEQLECNTPESLQVELNQLILFFGTDIEPNIWISFQYYKDIREQDAENYAVRIATAVQKQEHQERNDMANLMRQN